VDENTVLVQSPGYTQEQLDPFTFDHAFDQQSTQEEIYNTVVEPVVQGVLNGINGTVFCYGQTGSGKTYTMEGTDKDPGLLPRLGSSIFEHPQVALERVSVCFVEIYMEKLQDLLDPTSKVEVRETMSGNVYLANACERVVSTASDILSCVKAGQKNRSVATTKMNERSSRSHSVFSISLKTCDSISGLPLRGVLHFVDLAGSESQGKTGAVGHILEQSKHINQSLLGLGRVIGALGTAQAHVPYRDSKLTRILQDSLGGNARTSLIVNISPEAVNVFETFSSLRFGQGASLVKNAPRVNLVDLSVSDLRKLLGERDEEIARLRARVAAIEAPTPQKKPTQIMIGTPEKRKTKMHHRMHGIQHKAIEGSGCPPVTSRAGQACSWARLIGIVILMAIQAYMTNPVSQGDFRKFQGDFYADKGDFRQFLQSQHASGLVHCMLESVGLININVWNIGLASVGQENNRFFLGAFDQWVKLGEIPAAGCLASRDLIALTLAVAILFMFHMLLPCTTSRHCIATYANIRAGRLWSLILSQLFHQSSGHLLANVFFLFSIGPHAHALLGRHRFFSLFFGGGCCTAVGSLILRHVVHKRHPVALSSGSCGPLFVLLGYLHATGCYSNPDRWLSSDWGWTQFILLQTLIAAPSRLDIVVPLVGGAVGWSTGKWQLLDAIL